jgi:Protein of unknown function (DUF2009)
MGFLSPGTGSNSSSSGSMNGAGPEVAAAAENRPNSGRLSSLLGLRRSGGAAGLVNDASGASSSNSNDANAVMSAPASSSFRVSELAKHVPLRLSTEERTLLAVLEHTLNVSEYTDQIDVAGSNFGGYYSSSKYNSNTRHQSSKTQRILDGIFEGTDGRLTPAADSSNAPLRSSLSLNTLESP